MDAWKQLEAAGLPTGAIRPAPRQLDAGAVRHAVESILDGGSIAPALREPLLAWLAAWQHHWPSSFDDVLGAAGRQLAASVGASPLDANRYLKLRRIAIENLAGVL